MKKINRLPFASLLVLLTVVAIYAVLTGCQSGKNENTGMDSDVLDAGFLDPPKEYHPETWFHINGNNISKEGLTKDLEAIKYAGLQGIQLFFKSGAVYPNVPQTKILSPEWEKMIGHAANECQRLGLKFTMQNCPGWSEAGGPWVPIEEAQRELVESVTRVEGGKPFDGNIPVNKEYLEKDYDYKDVCTIAFPTPKGDLPAPFVPVKIESNNKDIPWENIFDFQKAIEFPTKGIGASLNNKKNLIINKVGGQDTYVQVQFKQPVTLRSLRLPPVRAMVVNKQYPFVDVKLIVQAIDGERLKTISELSIPSTNWSDGQYDLTLALPEVTTKELRITFAGEQPLLLGYLYFQSKPRIHNFEAKAAHTLRSLQQDVTPEYGSDCMVDLNAVIDLTKKMDESGKLSWNIPNGNWTIVRYGHVNMRVTNGPAVPEATGWECSKLDKIALENHLRKGMIGRMLYSGGPIGDGKLNGLVIDSWEKMVPTWTINKETIFKEFQNRRGYDIHPFMPAMMGYIVKDQLTTEKFLRDLRETMDDLFVENFFAHFRTVAHDMGAKVYTEGATGEVLPGDALRYYGAADVPMTEFWFPRPPSAQTENAKSVFCASSATHLYNKKVLAAESCTEIDVTWRENPYTVKYLIDKNFTLGINHMVFHTFSHTPQTEVYPGSSFGSSIGFPFVRNQTWWRYMPDFVNYLSRCQFMLQQGEYVADVLWYIGDELERPPFQTEPFPEGHKYDFLNPEVLHTRLSVENGKIRVKDGGEYRVIMLRNSKRMLRSTAERIKELVLAGAVILGDKPQDSPSLMDGPEDVAALKTISNELWGEGASGVKKVGKGKVYWGKTLDDVLKEEAIAQDVIVPDGMEIPWIHRQLDGADIYFLSNQNENAVDASISFRTTGKTPELWDPFTGERKYAGVWQSKDSRTNVALSFDPNGSMIVVFRKNAKGKKKTVPVEVESQSLNNSWTLAFEKGWDAPATLELPELASLTENSNPTVKYYSGTVTYRKDFELSGSGDKITLDLGAVENIAEVWCNGKKVGTRWCPPFIFDLTGFAQQGTNKLEVKVTNTWRNQLIYDLQHPKGQKKTWTTNPPLNPDEKPSSSGLIGPVEIRTISLNEVLDSAPLKALKSSKEIQEAFPGQDFKAFPPLSEPEKNKFPELYMEVISMMKPRQLVVVAMPDQFHYPVVMEAIKHDQHVLCVKPLVLKYEQAVEIEEIAYERGLFFGVEYHKRFDRRSLIAKRSCELKQFGEFVMGEEKLIEPYLYRSSNFQNWFTCDKTDPFVYIGCHYVDLVYFITGFKPVEVSVPGIKGKFPNGNEGYMWANGRIRFENNALLSVIDGLGYPDEAAGSNDQSLSIFFEGEGKTGMVKHEDHYRGVEHSYLEGIGCGGSHFNFVSPDFYKLVPWEGEGYKPVGYGFDSVSASVTMACMIENEVIGISVPDSLAKRQEMIKKERNGLLMQNFKYALNYF